MKRHAFISGMCFDLDSYFYLEITFPTWQVITTVLNNCILFLDAEYEFVGMGNRHIPTKCVALGTWDNPGNEKALNYV